MKDPKLLDLYSDYLLALIAGAWLPIVLTLVLSTLITMAATAGIMWLAVRLFARRP